MSPSNSPSLARILVAPWQQRRNAGGLWGVVLVVAMCFAAPVVLLAWSLFCDPGQQATMLRLGAGRSAWIGVAALLVAGWAMLVGNVLRQNHPTLARLVPDHAGQLRTALLVAWALVSLTAAALPGFAYDAPLAWACGSAGALALLAAALRWPVLWLAGIAAPFVVGWLVQRMGAAEFEEAMWAPWARNQVLFTGVVVTAGALVLVALIRDGGAGHGAAYASRQRLLHLASGTQPAIGSAPSCSSYGRVLGLTVVDRPYAWWMDRLLARRDSPVMARLLVGLGPATHWTTRIFQAFWFLVAGGGLCGAVMLVVGNGLRAYILPWLAFSVLTGVCTNSLQAVPRLQRTRREQALLVLLPGVPRGGRLNRWLAWQMSVSFVLAALGGLALAWALNAFAEAIQPGVVQRATGGMTFGIAAALLPQVAWQWRRWAGMRGASGAAQSVPGLAPIVLGILTMVLHAVTGIGYLTVAVVLAAVSVLYCAWRWWRMGREPTALPVGRLA